MRKYFIENISWSQKRGIFFILLDSASKARQGQKQQPSSRKKPVPPPQPQPFFNLCLLSCRICKTREKKNFIQDFAQLLSTNQKIFLGLDLEPNVMLTMRNASLSKFWILKDNLQSAVFIQICEVIQTRLG